MKYMALPLVLFVATPALADINCKTVADDVTYQDQILKAQAGYFAHGYDDSNDINIEARSDYFDHLDNLINTVRRDIDGMRWLLENHCVPAKEEPDAIKRVREMELTLTTLTVRRMGGRATH
jgi:hypothetical protein